jgi:type IV pilus assembly protein PilB
MTGHQVYTTLHTNSAVGAIPRLLDLGVLPDIMAGNIIGIIAQRLVRRLCPRCKSAYMPDAATRAILGLKEEQTDITLYKATGCAHCGNTGYKGRKAIVETLKLDADIDERIAQRATGRELRKLADTKGFRKLADDGIDRVLAGDTSLEEIARVVDLTDRVA